MLSVEKSRASRMSLHLNYEIVPQLYTYERKSLRLCNEHAIFGYHHTMRKASRRHIYFDNQGCASGGYPQPSVISSANLDSMIFVGT